MGQLLYILLHVGDSVVDNLVMSVRNNSKQLTDPRPEVEWNFKAHCDHSSFLYLVFPLHSEWITEQTRHQVNWWFADLSYSNHTLTWCWCRVTTTPQSMFLCFGHDIYCLHMYYLLHVKFVFPSLRLPQAGKEITQTSISPSDKISSDESNRLLEKIKVM